MKTLNIPVEVPDDFPSEFEHDGKMYEPSCARAPRFGDMSASCAVQGGGWGVYHWHNTAGNWQAEARIILREIQMPPRPTDEWLDKQPCDAGMTWRVDGDRARVPDEWRDSWVAVRACVLPGAGEPTGIEHTHASAPNNYAGRRWIVRKVPRVAETVRCEITRNTCVWRGGDSCYAIMDAWAHPRLHSLELANGERVTEWNGKPFTGERRVVAVHLNK